MDKNRNDETIAPAQRPGLWGRPQATRVCLLVLVFGLLLWARFILVTGHPRTAVADPPASQAHVATGAQP